VTTTSKLPTEMAILSALGFGPETLLLSEPKMFMNERFLASLLVELEDELESNGAQRALFQIGLLFGLRDAYRMTSVENAEPSQSVARSTLLALQFRQDESAAASGTFQMPGTWPDKYEAYARLLKLGPDTMPSCAMSAGYTSGWLSGTLDTDVLVIEETCTACGDTACSFTAHEVATVAATRSKAELRLVPELSYDAFREISRSFAQPLKSTTSPTTPPIDFDPTMVHVWGPVMVLPFTNIDESLRTVKMLGRTPDTCDVRSVVIDLQGECLDKSLTTVNLENILETVETWGAEAILANVSPLAEPIVADLEIKHLLLRKNLPEAIATAFQVAEAQRHIL
jgi:predicted hydrocarbon binding protein